MATQANLRSVDSDGPDDTFRTPPNNLEAEQALLGAILVNNEACDRVSSFLLARSFLRSRPCPHL